MVTNLLEKVGPFKAKGKAMRKMATKSFVTTMYHPSMALVISSRMEAAGSPSMTKHLSQTTTILYCTSKSPK